MFQHYGKRDHSIKKASPSLSPQRPASAFCVFAIAPPEEERRGLAVLRLLLTEAVRFDEGVIETTVSLCRRSLFAVRVMENKSAAYLNTRFLSALIAVT